MLQKFFERHTGFFISTNFPLMYRTIVFVLVVLVMVLVIVVIIPLLFALHRIDVVIDLALRQVEFVLFDELGFHGDANNYFNPRNSFLPYVLESKQGLPITLTIIYKLVAERIGLEVDGIRSPGHFLARLRVGEDLMIVDPFFGGDVLNSEELADRVALTTGQREVVPVDRLPSATNRQWVARFIANLIHIYSMQGCPQSIAAMSELYDALKVTY